MKVYEKKSRCEIFRVLAGEVGEDSKRLIRIETHGTPRIERLDMARTRLDFNFLRILQMYMPFSKESKNQTEIPGERIMSDMWVHW